MDSKLALIQDISFRFKGLPKACNTMMYFMQQFFVDFLVFYDIFNLNKVFLRYITCSLSLLKEPFVCYTASLSQSLLPSFRPLQTTSPSPLLVAFFSKSHHNCPIFPLALPSSMAFATP